MIKLLIGPPAWARIFTIVVLGAAFSFLMAASVTEAQFEREVMRPGLDSAQQTGGSVNRRVRNC